MQFGFQRSAVEAADARVDRVDRPPADGFQDGVARLLEPQPTLDDGPVITGERDRVRVAEESGACSM